MLRTSPSSHHESGLDHSRTLPTPHKLNWRRTLIDAADNDREIDPYDFDDVRCEIQATGYHLVRSILPVDLSTHLISIVCRHRC